MSYSQFPDVDPKLAKQMDLLASRSQIIKVLSKFLTRKDLSENVFNSCKALLIAITDEINDI